MKRAGWIVWNVLTALSLLLCLASVTYRVRSYWVRDTVGSGWAGGNCHTGQSILGLLHVLINLGGGYVGGTTYGADHLSPQVTWSGGMSGYPPKARWRLGFIWQTYGRSRIFMDRISWTRTA